MPPQVRHPNCGGTGRFKMDGRRRRRLARAAAVTVALVAVAPAGGSPTGATASDRVPPPRTYRITATATLATEAIGNVQGRGLADFRGTVTWTHTYPRVTFVSSSFGAAGLIAVRGNRAATGTMTTRWDQGSDFCAHESGSGRGRATLMFAARYTLGANPRAVRSALNMGFGHGSLPASGDTPACADEHVAVVLGGRVLGTTVGGSYGPLHIQLRLMGPKSGAHGFPIERLLAGKGFSYSSRGTTRNTKQTRDDLAASGATYVTDGSMRVVYTPVR